MQHGEPGSQLQVFKRQMTRTSIAGRAVAYVNPKVPVKNIKELIEYAKANPESLSYGSAGNGSAGHLAFAAAPIAEAPTRPDSRSVIIGPVCQGADQSRLMCPEAVRNPVFPDANPACRR